MKKIRTKKSGHNNILALMVVGFVGLSGVWFLNQSKAATTNPYGIINGCTLSAGHTYVYGWAADPQATTLPLPNVTIKVGSVSKTAPTDIVYGTDNINAWIDKNRKGDPKPGTYGFKIDFGVLYPDTAYAITGTAINVGAGANTALTVSTNFPNNAIPNTCKGGIRATPPIVSITAPAANATVKDTISLSANASGNTAIKSVQFKIDGVNISAPDIAAPFTISWNSKSVGNGSHKVTAVATNTSNQSTTSAAITFNVNNPPPPATPPPPPPPPPAPPANNGGNTGGRGGSGSTSGNDTISVPQPSDATNATVYAGTLAAKIDVPAGNASKVKITYGTQASLLDQTTEEKNTSENNVEFLIRGLNPATKYFYKITRINTAGQSATSGIGEFQTSNFTVLFHFVNGQSEPISGVIGSIKGTELSGTSDSEGTLEFTNVVPGEHELVYGPESDAKTLPIVVDANGVSDEDSERTDAARLHYFVNVDAGTVTKVTSKSTNKALVVLSILLVAGLAGVLIFVLRRRHQVRSSPYEDTVAENYHFNTSDASDDVSDDSSDTVPDNAPEPNTFEDNEPSEIIVPPPVQPAATHETHLPEQHDGAQVTFPPENLPEHMGQSIKQMVLRSMAEAERQKNHGKHAQPDEPLDIYTAEAGRFADLEAEHKAPSGSAAPPQAPEHQGEEKQPHHRPPNRHIY